MPRIATLLAVLILALSGCADDGATTTNPSQTHSTYESQAPTEETGSIDGIVVDDEEAPVAGAAIAVLDVPGQSPEAKSSETGQFSIGGLPPGTYRLAVSQLGYEAFARKVDIVAGETVPMRVVLVPIAITTSTYKTELVNGLVGCSITFYTAQSAQPALTWVCGEAVSGTNWYPNHNNFHTWKVPKGYETHIAELDWTGTTDASKFMRMQLATSLTCAPLVCLVSTNYNQEKNGARPVKISFNYDEQKSLGKEFDLVARTRSGYPTGSTPGVVVLLDQKYTIYVTNFFGEQAPETFTATPPGP